MFVSLAHHKYNTITILLPYTAIVNFSITSTGTLEHVIPALYYTHFNLFFVVSIFLEIVYIEKEYNTLKHHCTKIFQKWFIHKNVQFWASWLFISKEIRKRPLNIKKVLEAPNIQACLATCLYHAMCKVLQWHTM